VRTEPREIRGDGRIVEDVPRFGALLGFAIRATASCFFFGALSSSTGPHLSLGKHRQLCSEVEQLVGKCGRNQNPQSTSYSSSAIHAAESRSRWMPSLEDHEKTSHLHTFR